MYNMFSEDFNEQELYYVMVVVISFLLEIGEVGKLFVVQFVKEGGSGGSGLFCYQGILGVFFFKKGLGQFYVVEFVEFLLVSLVFDSEEYFFGG